MSLHLDADTLRRAEEWNEPKARPSQRARFARASVGLDPDAEPQVFDHLDARPAEIERVFRRKGKP